MAYPKPTRRSWAEPWKIKMVEPIRLTVPRRVYTQAHMDVIAESVLEVFKERAQAQGLKMTYEPKYLRFFQARFDLVAAQGAARGA